MFAENDCFSHRGTASHTTQIRENGKTPLFRSVLGETGVLTDKPMNRVDAYGVPAHGRRRLQGQARLPRKLIGMTAARCR